MKVSIVIPVIKNDPFIKDCLKSIKKSTYKNIEIIVVDEGKERSEQRNIGLERATGDYVLWLDADQRVSKDLIKECVNTVRKGYDALFIPEVITSPGFFAKVRNFERSFLTATAVDVPRFILRRVFPRFDTNLTGPEDADVGQKITGLKGVVKNPIYHYDCVNFVEYCRKKAYYTKSMRKYAEKWPDDPCLNLKYRCFTIFTENGKWKKLLKHPILALGIVGVLIIRGIIYYANL